MPGQDREETRLFVSFLIPLMGWKEVLLVFCMKIHFMWNNKSPQRKRKQSSGCSAVLFKNFPGERNESNHRGQIPSRTSNAMARRIPQSRSGAKDRARYSTEQCKFISKRLRESRLQTFSTQTLGDKYALQSKCVVWADEKRGLVESKGQLGKSWFSRENKPHFQLPTQTIEPSKRWQMMEDNEWGNGWRKNESWEQCTFLAFWRQSR